MTVRIWEIEIDNNYCREKVVAPNINEAIKIVRKRRKGQYMNRIQDITKVEIIAEAE